MGGALRSAVTLVSRVGERLGSKKDNFFILKISRHFYALKKLIAQFIYDSFYSPE